MWNIFQCEWADLNVDVDRPAGAFGRIVYAVNWFKEMDRRGTPADLDNQQTPLELYS